MALDSRDLFVVQRTFGTDADKLFKTTAEDIADFIASTPAVHYMGQRDFTNVADTPGSRAGDSAPEDGDLWVNGQTTAGRFAWTPDHQPRDPDDGTSALPVTYFDKCIWNANESKWDVFTGSDSEGTLTGITAQEPLVVDDSDPAVPDLKIAFAKYSDGTTYVKDFPTGDEPGVVQSIALESDVEVDPLNPDDPSPNPNAVVPAELLKETNRRLLNAVAGGVSDVDHDGVEASDVSARWSATYNGSTYGGDPEALPASVIVKTDPTDPSHRTVVGLLAGVDEPGAFLAPIDADVNPDNADTSVPDGGLSKVHAVTPNLVYEYYTPRNFSLLPELS
jgi:hypothetical protein